MLDETSSGYGLVGYQPSPEERYLFTLFSFLPRACGLGTFKPCRTSSFYSSYFITWGNVSLNPFSPTVNRSCEKSFYKPTNSSYSIQPNLIKLIKVFNLVLLFLIGGSVTMSKSLDERLFISRIIILLRYFIEKKEENRERQICVFERGFIFKEEGSFSKRVSPRETSLL